MQVPFGMGIAVNIRVGNELGAGNPLSAKRASYVAIIMQRKNNYILVQGEFSAILICIVFFAVIISVAILGVRNHIGRIFSHDE